MHYGQLENGELMRLYEACGRDIELGISQDCSG